jgi:hypothetical protein
MTAETTTVIATVTIKVRHEGDGLKMACQRLREVLGYDGMSVGQDGSYSAKSVKVKLQVPSKEGDAA